MHQSAAARSEHFEGYLNWLLSRDNGAGEGEQSSQVLMSLDDPIPPDLRKRSKSPVKKFRVGADMETAAVRPARSAVETQKTTATFKPTGEVWEGVKRIMHAVKAPIPDLFFDNGLGDNDVRVNLELSCTKRKADATAGEFLGKLGHALRHSEADAFEIQLADGSKIRAEQMKVEKDIRVECVEKQPLVEPMFSAMVGWFTELIANQTIIEEEAFGNTK